MITCPHCNKGMIWGVYMDLPEEMKSGEAEWVACETPDHDEAITCPSCQEDAGIYKDLYAADADNRKQQRERKKKQIFDRIQIQDHPEYFLLGVETKGSFHRDKFFENSWKILHDWIQKLKSDSIITRSMFQDLPDSSPQAIGARVDHPSNGNPLQCRYFAGILFNGKIPEKLQGRIDEPGFEDPNNTGILHIPAATYSTLHFSGQAKEFFQLDKVIHKEWLENQNYDFASKPCLEFYEKTPQTWPDGDSVEITYHFPIQPSAEEPAEISPPQESQSEEVVNTH